MSLGFVPGRVYDIPLPLAVYKGYFAGFDRSAPAAGTYRLWVTSFESVITGDLLVARK